jgi:hypothetical protein
LEKHSVLEAKIRELEEAFQESSRSGDIYCAAMYNAELIPLLLRLADAVRDSKADRGADS